MLRLADAWHARVRADEVVAHAFSHGFRAEDGRLRRVLHDYFSWATTGPMTEYHRSAADVPYGLPFPHWSWNGLEPEIRLHGGQRWER